MDAVYELAGLIGGGGVGSFLALQKFKTSIEVEAEKKAKILIAAQQAENEIRFDRILNKLEEYVSSYENNIKYIEVHIRELKSSIKDLEKK